MAETTARGSGEMRRSLTLTGVTVNAMALIAPGAFLWTTFQEQSALSRNGLSTASDMWTGLFFALILALLTAYSYSELARIYPDAGTGSSYYFAEAALLDKASPAHRKWARFSKLSVGWISHLYYWIYPGIMVAFTATLAGYIYTAIFGGTLSYYWLGVVCVAFAFGTGYIAYRGITTSTMAAIIVNVIQIVALVSMSVLFIVYRFNHPHGGYEIANAVHVIIPHSYINLLYQSTIAILLLVGFESITALGSEAINPGKDIRRGVLISLIIQGGICYMFEYFATNFAIGKTTMPATVVAGAHVAGGYPAAAVNSAPVGTILTNVANTSLNNSGMTVSVIVAFTVLLALIGTMLACLNTAVRVTYSMAKDKEMPGLLGLLHGRFATPTAGIWILVTLSAGLGIFGANPHQVDNLTQITLASNTGTFLVYGFTCAIAVVAFASRHDKSVIRHLVLPGVGAVMNFAELVGVVYIAVTGSGTSPGDAYKAIGIVVIWILIGVIWVARNPNMRGTKLLHDPGQRTDAPVATT